jgi:hypothetical protein
MVAEEKPGKIVTIYGDNCDPRVSCEQVVGILEEALERARSGEIKAIGLAVLNFDESTGHFASGQFNSAALIGATYRLLRSISG